MSPDVSNTCVCEILKLSRLVANNRIATGKSFIDFFLNNEVFMFGIISVTQGVLGVIPSVSTKLYTWSH